MKVEIHDYTICTQSGDALVLVYGDTTNFDDIIFDGTVNFEFTVDKYQTGDGYLTPIENWMDVEITDVEYFDNENRRIKPNHDIQTSIEYNLIELIKDKEND